MSDSVLGATNLSVSLCGVVWRVMIVITKVKGKLCQATLNVLYEGFSANGQKNILRVQQAMISFAVT